ncbi:ferritin-like fold-containing protein [Sphaerisporangium sp. TRM90804]|uniref:ferritin-like fold-containing protein n=1 Tax=Sphaerisporangium sp. TRM90804 TaxID=3031113 RepID=UPI00244B4429|nr:ferritin-like fold-containing protein [Sphaerisporangium sp. TRM90804]MDH2429841.1 ferritin-like fold-containing protein [Sphaerisporangium sp. TRM90804]
MSDSPPGVVDLLGVLAYAELTAFLRMAEDAATLSPTLNDRAALSELAASEYAHFRLLRDRLSWLGVDPEEAMAPFVAAIDDWHAQTRPGDWLETLVKAYVGTGIAGDFYREAARHVEPETRKLVNEVLAEEPRSEFAVERVRAALAENPANAGRLALWARRMVGEALSQAHRLAAARPELAVLLVSGALPGDAAQGREAAVREQAVARGRGGTADADLVEIGRMFARLTEQHGRRMAALGLVPGP